MSRAFSAPLARALAAALPVAWLLAVLLTHVWLADLAAASASLRAFAQANALVCAALLLRPAVPAGLAGTLAWGGALAAVSWAWAPADTGAVALGVLLMLLCADACEAAAARLARAPGGAQRATLAVFALAGAAPLWASPLAERIGGSAAELILAASPLTLLAVLAGHDYLRDPWLYAHSALGTLRVAYPGALALVAGYAGAGALLLAVAHTRMPSHSRSLPA